MFISELHVDMYTHTCIYMGHITILTCTHVCNNCNMSKLALLNILNKTVRCRIFIFEEAQLYIFAKFTGEIHRACSQSRLGKLQG